MCFGEEPEVVKGIGVAIFEEEQMKENKEMKE